MADLTYTQRATERRASPNLAAGKGDAANVKCLAATVIAAISTSVLRKILFGFIPTNARILGASKVYYDDLASTGAPTLDIGLASVNSNVTSDPDALTDGLTVATAAPTGAAVVKDHANYGKRAWEFVSGVTEDPTGLLAVYGSLVDAGTTAAGDITLELYYVLD